MYLFKRACVCAPACKLARVCMCLCAGISSVCGVQTYPFSFRLGDWQWKRPHLSYRPSDSLCRSERRHYKFWKAGDILLL